MQFDSYIYALFLPVVFLLYWALARHLKWQNALLLIASYTFYGWWDWRFLGLIIATSLSSWGTALAMDRPGARRKLWATLSIVFNLGILGTFKYLNFFIDGARDLMQAMGFSPDWPLLHIVLPVGISFYTFQAISYTIDCLRGDIKPTRNLTAFMVYIAFFPQLVAGPIERARDLLPQLLRNKEFDYHTAVLGMRQILWGLTKKVVVADSLGGYLDTMLYNPAYGSATTIVMASIVFAMQIYADFSGYSDIAIGSAKLLNIKLSPNFRYPFFSRSWNEMWTRWHISLMKWLRNYVYFPLGGSRQGHWRTALNVMIVFAISGLWHGAAWTFVLWGTVCGLLMLPRVFFKADKRPDDTPALRDLPRCFMVFMLFAFAFLIFRAHSIAHLGEMATALVHGSWTAVPMGVTSLTYIVPLLAIDWMGRRHEFPLASMPFPAWARWTVYWTLLVLITIYSTGKQVDYIYFQF